MVYLIISIREIFVFLFNLNASAFWGRGVEIIENISFEIIIVYLIFNNIYSKYTDVL